MRLACYTMLMLCTSVYVVADTNTTEKTDANELFSLSLAELLELNVRSASKIDTALQRIPASVTVLTRSDINNYGYQTLTEILRNLPGIYLEEDTEEIYFGTRGSIGGSVQFLVNGVPQNRSVQQGLTTVETNRMNIPIAAIDRIEFIRGPMSVVYGNNAFIGTLNVITNMEKDGIVQLAFGTNKNSELFLHNSSELAFGSYSLNVGASRQGSFSGDYKDMFGINQQALLTADTQPTMQDHMQRELKSIDFYGQLQGFSTSIRYQHSQYSFYPALPPTINGDNELDLNSTQIALAYEFKPAPTWRSHSIVMYGKDRYDIDKFYFLSTVLNGFQRQHSNHFEFEQNVEYLRSENNSLLMGYRYSAEKNVQNEAEVDINGSYIIDFNTQTRDVNSQDAFVQYNGRVGQRTNIVLGARYSRLPNGHLRTTIGDKTASYERSFTLTEDRNQWNYRFALQYDLNVNNQLKFLFGTASQQPKNSRITDPESIHTMELVHVFASNRWLLQQSFYQNEIDNIVRRALMFDATTTMFVDVTVNDGEWDTLGYEVSGEYRINDSWRVAASGSWQTTDDLNSNLDVGYSPEQLVKLKTDYRLRRHTFALSTHYVSSRYADW